MYDGAENSFDCYDSRVSMIGAKINFLSFDAGKELHHLPSICSGNLSFACAAPVARNSAAIPVGSSFFIADNTRLTTLAPNILYLQVVICLFSTVHHNSCYLV